MDGALARVRSVLARRTRRVTLPGQAVTSGAGGQLVASGAPGRSLTPSEHDPEACSWEAMREVYAEQAARGVPEAIRGLELIEQGRWPRSGQPRSRHGSSERNRSSGR